MLANLLQEFAAPLSKEQVNKFKEALGDLSLEQVNWLSGYLAGIAATGAAAGINDIRSVVGPQSAFAPDPLSALSSQTQAQPAQVSSDITQSTILYGSQTGNAKGVAQQLKKQLEQADIAAELIDLADFNPKQIKKLTRVFLIVSTHGEGEPPDDAVEFYDFMHSKKVSDLSQLEFAVLALGDSSYEHFCQTGKDFEAAFEAAGASKLFARIDCDVDYQGDSERWQQAIQEHLQANRSNLNSSDTQATPQLSIVEREPSVDKFNPLSAEVIDVVAISASDANKQTFHVEIDLANSGLQYQPGDTLGIWPINSKELVTEVIARLGANGDELVTTKKGAIRLFDCLQNERELTQVSPGFISWLAKVAQDNSLLEISQNPSQLKALIQRSQIPDLLEQFPCQIDVQEFVEQLRAITPRLYSIASSQAEVEDEVHLTVGLVANEQTSKVRFGAASAYLASLTAGDSVKVFIESNKHFRLPDDPSTPIVMIGAGTGIAPYRGFMQQREHSRGPLGESWLFFGNQHFSADFLYQLEWQQYLKKGVLSHIELAFSRDQKEKVYVQDRMLEQADKLYELLESGAHFYLCGDQQRLAKSVEEALVSIIEKHGQLSSEAAINYLNDLKKQGRYQKDVY
ncbi:MAG: assimilatory sulfite reductase (NADPH) flavoprotein subunit [Gammaproteobacteria bacterium]|nr:assimilatory sulfite reductase (NADPH) flavoprotein subunit [Gammaproteobacteria bacterium]